MSIENKISTRDLTKLIIFGFLQIPYLFLFGWNVIPILILLTGFLLAKRDKLLTTMKKSILFCKCYIILTFIICLIPFIEQIFIIKTTYFNDIFFVFFLISFPIIYLLILVFLFSKPIEDNSILIFSINNMVGEINKNNLLKDELVKLKKLRDDGLISELEFQEMRKNILGL